MAAPAGRPLPMVRSFGRLRAYLPFRVVLGLALPAGVFGPFGRDLDPFVQDDGHSFQGDRLVIAGCAYIPSVDISERRHTTKLVALAPRGRRRLPVLTRARSVRS